MQLFDTHTHLYLSQFNEDRDEVINSAVNLGIEKLLLPNIDSKSINPLLELCNIFPDNCFPALGLHPTSVKNNYKEELDIIEDWINKTKVYAIGETGIDLYWDKTFIKEQIKAFSYQIELAIKYNLPVIIHMRESFDQVIEVLDNFKGENLTGVFHCFTGTIQQAEMIVKKGFKLGIGGVVTFKNSGLDVTLKKFDMSHIILETDSPYLAPVPKRGKRNESSYLIHIAKKVADIKELTITKLAEITTNNAKQLFNI